MFSKQNIGIMTYWWSNDNYGQLLQLFGLYNDLQTNGYCPEVIRFRLGQEKYKRRKRDLVLKVLNPKKVFRFVGNKIKKFSLQKKKINFQQRRFDEFRINNFLFSADEFYTFSELQQVNHEYDAIIVGSDQVWNYMATGEQGLPQIDAYTLRFDFKGDKRLSYAASMGFGGLEDIHLSRIVENLNAFEGVSVREESAKEILESRGIKDVEWVPDPSMLLPAERYLQLVKNDTKYHGNLFIYYVNNPSVLSDKSVAKVLDVIDKSYVFVGANNLYNKKLNAYPTIEEWLSYIYHSEMVLTNSFHGCVFSILFHKDFYYIPLKQNALGHVDTRIDSLLGRLGIEERSISTVEELKAIIKKSRKPIDWDAVDSKLHVFVQVGKDFLAKHLGEEFPE